MSWVWGSQARLDGVGWGHRACLTQLSTHTHARTQIRERKMAAHWSQKFSAIWGYAEFYLSFLWGRYILTLSKQGFNFIELPSFLWVRALKGGKYLQWHYSSLAVCMSACYPRLGQNTPLVQKREKKKRRDSLTNRHSTTAALHNHYAKTDTTSQSLMRRQTKLSPIKTIWQRRKRLMRKRGELRWVKASGYIYLFCF